MTTEEMSAAITASPTEFADIFIIAQQWAREPAPVNLSAVATSTVPVEMYMQALKFAEQHGWLKVLLRALVDKGAENGKILASLEKPAIVTEKATLEAITNALKGFMEPDLIMKGIMRSLKSVGKVLIDNQPKGTCFLIRPHLVLTAWHVVKNLYDGHGKPLTDSHERLQFEFDDVNIYLQQDVTSKKSTIYRAHKDWNIIHDACHAVELNDKLPDNVQELCNFLDYAIIRLEKVVDMERPFHDFDRDVEVVPNPMEPIIVFQHPQGSSLQFDYDLVTDDPSVPPGVMPAYRFLHLSNTTPGSSGGPIYNKQYKMIGIHQGKWKEKSNGAGKPQVVNRGVPMCTIKENIRIKNIMLPLPQASDITIWRLGAENHFHPVIARDELQSAIWNSIFTGGKRIFRVTGAPDSGKSFCVPIISCMLSGNEHLKIYLDAGVISKSNAVEVCNMICYGIGSTKTLPPASQDVSDSTKYVWLRNEVIRFLLETIEAERRNRKVWIFISRMDETTITGLYTDSFLLALYEQVATCDWLRIVLDGREDNFPYNLETWVENYVTPTLTPKHIADFIRRNCASDVSKMDIAQRADTFAQVYFSSYETERRAGNEAALKNLATLLVQTLS